jgi:1-acyl-sn-glycerol-3-phosphate acyltransferase
MEELKYGTKIYAFTKKFCYGFLKIFFRFTVVGAQNVPLEGPVLFASNHQSFLDPVLMGVASPKMIVFMSRDDLFKYPVLSWILPRMYVIPLERGAGDLGAIKAAIRALKSGQGFGIFPEGRRSRTGQLEPFKSGAAAIAMRTGATVVPVGITGSKEAWGVGKRPRLFTPVRLTFGEPIQVALEKVENEKLAELTKKIEAAVARLLPPEYLTPLEQPG